MNCRILLSLCFLVSGGLQAGEVRSWTSRDGSATVEGKLFRETHDEVTLVLANGRSQNIRKEFLSDADLEWLKENAEVAPAPGSESKGAPPTAKIPSALEGRLVNDRGEPTSIVADGSAPRYYLFYYSASWCGPCVAFTPQLVRFYRKVKSRNASIEFVLVPSDKSRDEAVGYMKSARMPWPGLDFDQKDTREVPRSSYGFIPSMVLTDADGTLLLEMSKSITREDFLKETEKIITGS